MNLKLNRNQIERFSRQIILKNIGILGQKKIIQAKVLIVGMGGLGCPVAEFLTRAGVGNLGIVDSDNVDLSNIHRQSLYDNTDLKKPKVISASKKLKKINPKTKINIHKVRLNRNNLRKIIKNYDFVVDGSDNFETKFLINDFCIQYKKFLVTGAISKFDGHIFKYNFKKRGPCLRCFMPEHPLEETNCETDGIFAPVAGILGALQANEVLKTVLNLKDDLNNNILIFSILLIIALWIYSHKLRKKVLLGEITASLLLISFFLGMAVLNQKFDFTLAVFCTYIFTIDLTRGVVKKMISLKGDLIVGEKSIPIYFGIKNCKYIIFFLMISSMVAILTLLPIIIYKPFSYYFIVAFFIISVSIYLLHFAKIKSQYEKINSIYKLLLGLAIISITLY